MLNPIKVSFTKLIYSKSIQKSIGTFKSSIPSPIPTDNPNTQVTSLGHLRIFGYLISLFISSEMAPKF